MKILLLGKNGQVGWELQRSLQPLGHVLSVDRHDVAVCGDLARIAAMVDSIRQWHPDVIVNAAAYTAVDRAESDVETAMLINRDAPGALAVLAHELNALLVHYSTDYVFDGSGTHYWREHDTCRPLSVYGATKQQGESRIAQSGCHHLVFRTSWVYAARGHNFAKTMLRLAQEKEQLRIVSDQVGAPTGADLIADVTAHAIAQWASRKRDATLSGIYHLVAAGETNWCDYARRVIAEAHRQKPELAWKVNDISPIATSDYPVPAKRPLNSRLSTEKLQQTFSLSLPDWTWGVDRLVSEIIN